MAANVIDANETNFESEVIEASRSMLVLVDFWAPWCGPCRALGPMLEKLALEYAGRFKLVKVNSDESRGLAQGFGIRSIPDVYAFKEGKAVSHFLGAQPESQIRAFIDRLLPSPADLERTRAADLRTQGDPAGAEAALRKAIELAPKDDRARVELAELLLAEKRGDAAVLLLEDVRPDRELDVRVAALKAAAAFARAAGGDEDALLARIAVAPADIETRDTLAQLYAGSGRFRQAMDQLLEILRRERNWKDGEARKQILNIFNLAAADAELVGEYRRKLSRTLN